LHPHTEAKAAKPYAVLQSVFIVMVFVADTHCSTFIRQNTRADKRAASPHTEQKPTPKKTA
jgi:hypothetical protein